MFIEVPRFDDKLYQTFIFDLSILQNDNYKHININKIKEVSNIT